MEEVDEALRTKWCLEGKKQTDNFLVWKIDTILILVFCLETS